MVFGYKVEQIAAFFNDAIGQNELTLDELRNHVGGLPIGAIRASFGYANNADDAQKLVRFVRSFLKK